MIKVLIECGKSTDDFLRKYVSHIESFNNRYKIVDIEQKYLPYLKDKVRQFETNFILELHKEKEDLDKRILDKENIIIAVMGKRYQKQWISHYYNMTFQKEETVPAPGSRQLCEWINCFSENDLIDAASYIQCIKYLCNVSKRQNKPLIIYDFFLTAGQLSTRKTMIYRMLNDYIKRFNAALMIKASVPKEADLERLFFSEESFSRAANHLFSILYDSKNVKLSGINNENRQVGLLYNDVFYQTIPSEQEIYVLPNTGNFKEPAYYEALGFRTIPLFGNFSMLYARKEVFDAQSEIIRADVMPQYQMPIVSYGFCNKTDRPQSFPYSVIADPLQFRGRGVYIGVISIEGIDYTSDAFRNPDGTTRIAYIWQQQQADEGTSFFKEQINAALQDPGSPLGLEVPIAESMSTMMLSIAGGESRSINYRGVATEAEFLIAKINPAPEVLQIIYGGVPHIHGALMPDVLIGALQLMNFAKNAGRPLVLCVPFNSNIDPHDGSYLLNQMLSVMAQSPGVTIVVPSGEEADKLHHQGFEGRQEPLRIVNIRVDKESQNVVGVIYYKFATLFNAVLFPPQGVGAEPIDIRRMGITRISELSTVYSNGERTDFANGTRFILFRIENPQVGGWRLEMTIETDALTQVDIWLAQQELNPFTNLRPSSPFITVGSTANSSSLMSVGGYSQEDMVVLKTSGRGYAWDRRIKPLFITNASNIVALCGVNDWAAVSSTLVASSIMLGVIAALYSKFIEEQIAILPNTLIMNGIILRGTEQFEDIEYPNPSQGYGIFDPRSLSRLLATPFIL